MNCHSCLKPLSLSDTRKLGKKFYCEKCFKFVLKAFKGTHRISDEFYKESK